MLIPNTQAGRTGERAGQDLSRRCQPTKSSRDKPRRQNVPSQQRLGCVPTRGPGLPACRALWFKSHLKIACGYKACWLPAPRWNSSSKMWPEGPTTVTPPHLAPSLYKHFPGEPSHPHPFFQYHHPLPQMGKLRHRAAGTGLRQVAIEEPGWVEDRPVAASLAGSLPPNALELPGQPGLYLGLPCFLLEPTTTSRA